MVRPTTTTLPTRVSKRKRVQVSYCEEDYFDALDIEGQDSEDDSASEPAGCEEEDGLAYDSKPSTRAKQPPKKKVKRTPKPPRVKRFRFLDLPAELRDEIYDLALVEPNGLTLVAQTKNLRKSVRRGTISIEETEHYNGLRRKYGYFSWYRPRDASDSSFSSLGEATRQLVPKLLAVNKQIREEGSTVLYKQEIIMQDASALHHFLAKIGPYNRALVSTITVKGWHGGRSSKGHDFASATLLSFCTNMKTFFIDCSVVGRRDPMGLARCMFRDCHNFLEAIGVARGKFDAGLDVLRVSDWHFEDAPDGDDPGHAEELKSRFYDEVRARLEK